MGRRSKDDVYTILDKIADKIRDYKPSAATSARCEKLGRAFVKVLAGIGRDLLIGKVISRTRINKAVSDHTKAVAKEVGNDIKTKVKVT